jgi:hypothetical protein
MQGTQPAPASPSPSLSINNRGGGGINMSQATTTLKNFLKNPLETPMAIHWFGMSFVVVVLLWLITYVTTKINL